MTRSAPAPTRPARAHPWIWGVAGALACAAVTPLEPNMVEEGFHLDAAERLLRGERLYQDVVAFSGPLPYYGLAALFGVFGASIPVGRLAVAVLHGLATASTFGFARRAQLGSLAHVAAALMVAAPVLCFPLFSIWFYTTLAATLATVAGYAALRGSASTGWALGAGAGIAAVALCKQTPGAILALGLTLAVAASAPAGRRARACLALVAGGAGLAALTLAVYGTMGALGALVRSLVVLPLSFEPSFRAPFVNFWPVGSFSADIPPSQAAFYLPYFYALLHGQWRPPGALWIGFTQLLYALPFVAMIATALRRLRGPLPAPVAIHLCVLAAAASNLFPRTDWGHLVYSLPASAVQLVLLATPLHGEETSRRRRTARALVGVLGLATAGGGAWLHAISGPPTFGPRVPLRPVSEGYRMPAVPRVIRYLRRHTEPGDAVFVARAEPLLYFATETRNPTPYGGVIPGMREEQERVIVAALRDTRWVVMSDIDQPVYTYYRDEFPAVQHHLERHFHIPDDFLGPGSNWLLVLERGPDRGRTAVDLVDARSEARPWVRRRDGKRVPARSFREKLATVQNRRPLAFWVGPGGGGLDFELDVPPNALLQFDVGYPEATGQQQVYEHPRNSRLLVSVGEDGGFEVLSETRIANPRARVTWTPGEIGLGAFSGRRIRLRLELVPEEPLPGLALAWFGSPRVALPPPVATPSGSPRR